MMPSLDCVLQLRPFIPWVCTSLALGYAAYIHWRMQKVQALASKLQINKDKQLNSREEVNIDTVDRNVTKKKISYCRCWKSKNFPFCDGAHKYYNRENDDKTGPLVLVWNEPDNSSMMESTITDPDRDMDIKSIDSESPILQSSNGDSNGEFDQIVKIHNSSDEQLSSLEMIEDNFAAPVEVEGDFKVIETQHN